MAESYKVLAQSKPLAAALTDAYAVPAGSAVVVSTILICNQSATPTSYRIAIAVAGAADAAAQYICYDRVIKGNATHEITTGVTLGPTDVVRVYNTLATCSFNIFGSEIT